MVIADVFDKARRDHDDQLAGSGSDYLASPSLPERSGHPGGQREPAACRAGSTRVSRRAGPANSQEVAAPHTSGSVQGLARARQQRLECYRRNPRQNPEEKP